MRLELIPTPRGVLYVRESDEAAEVSFRPLNEDAQRHVCTIEGAHAFERAVATAKAAADRGRADA